MTTKNFVMEIPIALHDIVQDFIVSALAVRPASYVDFAVEYFLHLQAKGSRQACESFRVRSEVESPGADSEEVCVDGEPVSDTVNIFQVSINPDAFQSPDLKHYHSEDEPNDGDSIVDLSSGDQAVPTDSEIKLSDTSVTLLNRSLTNLKTENTLLQLNTSPVCSPSQSFPTINPFTLSLQGNSFTVASSNSLTVPLSSSLSILPINPSHTANIPTNLPMHNSSVPIPNLYPLTTSNNRPATTQYTTYPNCNASMNGFANHEVTSPMSTPHSSPFTSPYKSHNSHSHPGHHRHQPNNYQCKSCKGVFKPHPRPLRQPFYSLPGSPEASRSLCHSNQETPDRPAVHPLLQFPHNDQVGGNGSSNGLYTTSPRTTNIKSDPSERKFPCPICEKSYKSNTGLKRHLIVHTGERPYQCQYCFKSFYRKYVLTTHITRVHAKQIAATQS